MDGSDGIFGTATPLEITERHLALRYRISAADYRNGLSTFEDFNLITDVPVAALLLNTGAAVATPFITATDLTLKAELNKPGGTGGSLLDIFWITGNPA